MTQQINDPMKMIEEMQKPQETIIAGVKIIVAEPPIFKRAKELFESAEESLFAWGEVIYNPANINVDEFLVAHEKTHHHQQAQKGSPEEWWELYFTDDDFRADQEAQAYGEQYRVYCIKRADKNMRAKYLHAIATHLSSPLYNLGVSFAEAKQAILNRHFDRKL